MMNKNSLAIIFAAFVITTNAHADGYFGFKVGSMLLDDSIGIEDTTNMGIVVGTNHGSGGGLEFEFSNTTGGGELTFFPGAETEIQTIALYGVARSSGDAYIKGKIGFIQETVTISGPLGSVETDDTGSSYGIGFGFRSGNSLVEIEYSIVEEDVDFLGLSLLVGF